MTPGSPAWKPQATFADEITRIITSSAPRSQSPKLSPRSELKSTPAIPDSSQAAADGNPYCGPGGPWETPFMLPRGGVRAAPALIFRTYRRLRDRPRLRVLEAQHSHFENSISPKTRTTP